LTQPNTLESIRLRYRGRPLDYDSQDEQDGGEPMHVTSGYYKTTLSTFTTKPWRIIDPVQASRPRVLADRGTNGLLFSASTSNNFHSMWDKCLPGQVSGATCSSGPNGFTPLAVKLTAWLTSAALAAAVTTGDHHDWPATWATDVLHQAVTPPPGQPQRWQD